MVASMPGRWTLTTTRSPPSVVARCVCAMDAVARASGEKSVYSSPSGAPRPDSTTSRMVSKGSTGAASCRVSSAAIQSAGSRSRRMERICPSLMKVGPSDASRRAKRSAAVAGPREASPAGGSLAPNRRSPSGVRITSSPKP